MAHRANVLAQLAELRVNECASIHPDITGDERKGRREDMNYARGGHLLSDL